MATTIQVIAHALAHHVTNVNTIVCIATAHTVAGIDSTHGGTARRLVDSNKEVAAVGLVARVDTLDGIDVLTLDGNSP